MALSKASLTERARALGFDLCRVAPCSEPPHRAAFHAWLDAGRAGDMEWLERNKERRSDPRQVLPEARSIVVLALNYFQGAAPAAGPMAGARIARYAWGEDYHDLIGARLKALESFLNEAGGRQKCYVDTGPVLERDFAALAGIGWHGKSTMLINEKLGTWFFLAVILTTLDFPPDAPAADRCGRCTRCIDACPTNAITGPYELDSRRCISYLTIELKGSIPAELRTAIGDRIYGCDDCLAACPWNRFARVSQEAAFAARRSTSGMAPAEYLALTEEEFRRLFRGSPIKRIKRRGFLRNVCVALGNTGGAADLPALERASADPEPLIAEHALWAIGQIRGRLSPAPAE